MRRTSEIRHIFKLSQEDKTNKQIEMYYFQVTAPNSKIMNN